MAQGRPITAADASPPYLGQVATRCATPGDFNATNKEMMARECFIARDDITSVQFLFPNWHCKGGLGEQGSGGTLTLKASIEYPLGAAPQRIYFNNADTATIANLTTAISDALAITIPKGAQFAVKTFQQNPAATLFSGGRNSGNSGDTDREGYIGAASGVTDNTLTTTNPTAATVSYGPCAIIATTRRPSVFLAGDSKQVGLFESNASQVPTGAKGECERSIAKEFAYINAGTSSDRAQAAIGSYTLRLALAQYCTDIVCNYGINDIHTGARTAAQVIADLATFFALFGTKRVRQLTIAPYTTSTDSWATTANQTFINAGEETTRKAVNKWIRRVPSPLVGYFDVADIVESARDSGLWQPNYTTDGLHEASAGNLAIEQSRVIDIRAFDRNSV